MAAADYYNPGGVGGVGGGSTFGPEPPRPSHHLPYPVSDAPPPYSPYPNQRPTSQPPPPPRPLYTPDKPWPPHHPQQQHQSGAQYFSPPQQQNGHHPHFAPQDNMPQRPSALSNMYRPQDFAPHQPQQLYPPQQGGYFPPNAAAMAQAYDGNHPRPQSGPPPLHQRPASTRRRSDTYSRSRSRSRSRSHARRHHHGHHDQQRPRAQKKKSTGVPSFLGAGGGAIIGDAIFPGLGTIGGAILGGIGGHEFGRQRRSYSDTKDVRRDKQFDRDWPGDDYARGRRRDDR